MGKIFNSCKELLDSWKGITIESDSRRTSIKDVFGLLKGKITLAHFAVIAIFIIFTIFFMFEAYLIDGKLDRASIYSSLAVAFATATVADFIYMLVVMNDVEDMVAQHLMLRKEVQAEIMKPDKIDEIISSSLENRVGKKLAEALQKSVINKIAAERDLFLMESAYCSIVLNNSNDPNLCNDYFELTFISRFNMIIKSYKAVFYATSSEKLFNYLKNKDGDRETYHINKLPEIDPEILKLNFAINELKIDGNIISEPKIDYPTLKDLEIDGNIISEPKLGEAKYFVIRVEFDLHPYLQAQKKEMIKIKFSLKSLVSKHRHVFFRSIPRAYPSLHLTWDCLNTDIKEVAVIGTFLGTQPEIIRHLDNGKNNGKKIEILIDDWVLPNNMIAFIWSLMGVNE